MSFFLRRVRDRSESEDLVQEVFARLIASPNLSDIQNIEAFVFRVAGNLVTDRQRHASRWRMFRASQEDEKTIDELAQFFSENREPERVLLAKEDLASVMASLKELGERTCDMFILFRVENMKQRDIAALYGISISAVEKHIARAVMHLALKHTDRDK